MGFACRAPGAQALSKRALGLPQDPQPPKAPSCPRHRPSTPPSQISDRKPPASLSPSPHSLLSNRIPLAAAPISSPAPPPTADICRRRRGLLPKVTVMSQKHPLCLPTPPLIHLLIHSFIYSSTQSFNEYSSAHYVPGTVPGARKVAKSSRPLSGALPSPCNLGPSPRTCLS